jgi:hypothetical protein
VPVRQPANPSTAKVGEAALAGPGCGEVDTCVVQVEALTILSRDCLDGHPSPSLLRWTVHSAPPTPHSGMSRGCKVGGSFAWLARRVFNDVQAMSCRIGPRPVSLGVVFLPTLGKVALGAGSA